MVFFLEKTSEKETLKFTTHSEHVFLSVEIEPNNAPTIKLAGQ